MDWDPIRYAHNGDVSIAYTVGGRGPVDILVIGGFVSHLEIGHGASAGRPLLASGWLPSPG